MHRLSFVTCVLVAVFCCTPGSSVGADTTVSFSGHVDHVPDQLVTRFQADMPITGFYTFDESLASADFLFSVTEFQMTIGDYTAQQIQDIRGDITVSPTEYVAVSFADGDAIEGFSPLLMALQLSNSTPVFDTSSPLPVSPESLDSPLWTFDFSDSGSSIRLSGTIESIVVPEPSASLLSLIGLAVAGCAVRRRSRSKG